MILGILMIGWILGAAAAIVATTAYGAGLALGFATFIVVGTLGAVALMGILALVLTGRATPAGADAAPISVPVPVRAHTTSMR